MISQNESGGSGKTKVICGFAPPGMEHRNSDPSKIEAWGTRSR